MAEGNNICNCAERDEVELRSSASPSVVIVDDDDCCCCEEIELYSNHEPDIILFEEWCDDYVDDIVAAKEAAEAARDAINEKAGVIIEKENQLLADTSLIKTAIAQGVSEIKSKIASESADIKGRISTSTTTVRNDIASAKSALQGDIASGVQTILNAIHGAIVMDECTEEDIDNIFDE